MPKIVTEQKILTIFFSFSFLRWENVEFESRKEELEVKTRREKGVHDVLSIKSTLMVVETKIQSVSIFGFKHLKVLVCEN